jgi:NADH:ubiquinone reductase (H+-translocating)
MELPMHLSRPARVVSWLLQVAVAAILFQTLFFKFTGAEESRYIFRTLGLEPWGRIGSGVAELIAVVLLLCPRRVTVGAIVSLGVIGGAIVSHLTKLGIVVLDDGGLLFALAVAVFVGSAAILALRRREIPLVGHRFRPRHGPAVGNKTKILILGAGFGGVAAAIELEKTLARDQDVEVTLVNRENFFLFTPMLHEVAASDLDLTDIVSPLRTLLRRVNFFAGDVEYVDLERKRATLVHGSDGHSHEVRFDHLVVALGCETNFFDLPGLEERALTMKTLGDAIHLRNTVIARMEEADTECAAGVRGPLLTFVVAGGGFAGVETIGGLNDLVRESLRYYPNLTAGQVRTVLVHPRDLILPELGPELGAYAQRKLIAQGIEVRSNSRVASVDDAGVTLADGTFVPSRTVVWTAGTKPHPFLAGLACPKEKGRLVVNEFLEVPGHDGVWALGDCAVVPNPKTGKPHPPTAQHALRQGKVLAHNLEAAVRGGEKRAFAFSSLGQLAAIGRRTGVANVLGFKFSGFAAWFLWRTIYLSKLPRFEKKVRVALEWTLDLFFSKDIVQYQTVRDATRAPAISGTAATAGVVAPSAPRVRQTDHQTEPALH